jgi:hypothetical protein
MGRILTRYRLIIFSGILTFLFLITTMTLGITGINFTLHKISAIATLVFAIIHISPTVYNKIKMRKK